MNPEQWQLNLEDTKTEILYDGAGKFYYCSQASWLIPNVFLGE